MTGHPIGIGATSRRTGVNIETIRYYERIGLLPAPERTQGGHRLYSPAMRQRLRFICRSRELGFPVEEIRALLLLVDGGYTCGEVLERAREHLAVIRRRRSDLERMEYALARTVADCTGGAAPHCPVIEVLGRDRF